MTEHQLERIHNYTKFKVVELLIKKHQEGITLNNFDEIENDINLLHGNRDFNP